MHMLAHINIQESREERIINRKRPVDAGIRNLRYDLHPTKVDGGIYSWGRPW
jgi:hypothetical protein